MKICQCQKKFKDFSKIKKNLNSDQLYDKKNDFSGKIIGN